ncbi:hypothetical protein B9T54_02985 [Leptospira borgpetersenii serovar Hardjo-bovis]|nr:hypothetical protein B9T54_02985 [Leptospira borgpetersenii serovar Hardjo-bovis]
MLKNSMIQINKTASNIHFNAAETDRELILQQLYFLRKRFSAELVLTDWKIRFDLFSKRKTHPADRSSILH